MRRSKDVAKEVAQVSKHLLSTLRGLTQQRAEAEARAIQSDDRRDRLVRSATIEIVRGIPLVCGHCELTSSLCRWRFILATRLIIPFTDEKTRYAPASLGECLLSCPSCQSPTTISEHVFGEELVVLFSKFQTTRPALFERPPMYLVGATYTEHCPW